MVQKLMPKAYNSMIKTNKVNMMCGTDMTTTLTKKDGNASIFIAIDHNSSELMGIHASKKGTRLNALEPIRQGIHYAFGEFKQNIACGLTLRHDHGSQYISEYFQNKIKFLGIKSSASYVREPQGNGIAERFIRILKENLLWVRSFDTIEELGIALQEFRKIYNNNWLVAKHGYKSPAQIRQMQKTTLQVA